MDKRAIDKYGDSNTVLGNTISRTRRIEELRDSHRKIKGARGKLTSTGTKKLVIPNSSNDGHSEIVDKEAIEDILMMTNKEKFQQANVTPLVIEPLDSILGPRSLTREAEEILNGSYTIQDMIHPGAENFLTAVAMEYNVKTNGAINTQISIDEHQKF